MAQGIKLPLRSKNGRLVLASGDTYIEQLIATAMGSGDSDNPFQDLGLGEFMLFEINDELTEGEIRARVIAAFETLERDQLARLESLSFSSENEEKFMQLNYRNLETGRREELNVPIPGDE